MKELRDASLLITRALANGAANVTSTGIDTGKTTAQGQAPGAAELLLSAPAMNTTQMPDAKTMKYDIVEADSADLGTNPVTVVAAAITQTGAGGVGCAAATYRYRVASDGKRYVGFKATGSASGDSTTASATLEVVL